ncbi:MAG: deoxyribonuclease IV [Candidatus Dadabacteria bacterium]|nr:deoxyribonuclease IV [Candidatus Dadabacteria bacterium]MYA47676.1 deoxyribonuclease IV [Candidatus Dadabacteria bacterium]MYK49776.1 deoxyribonuclease IV [Candidatus Dadabacteria bacterium]
MKFGAHVSIAGGIENAPLRARQLGCECFQMFTRSPRGGKPPELEDRLLEDFFLNCSEAAISDYYVHTPYFINLASGKKNLREKSVALVREELERSSALGVKYMMTHIGSAKGLQREAAVDNVVDSLLRIVGNYGGTTRLLLENTAGQGDTIGASFGEISLILRSVAYDGLGVCIDTAHMFASGYDIRTREGIEELVESIGAAFAPGTVKLVHANDSKAEFNSSKDRHEHIGEGKIGIDCFSAMIGNPFFEDLDMIVEMPPPEVSKDVRVLKKLRDGGI